MIIIEKANSKDLPILAASQVAMARESEGMVLDNETVLKGIAALLEDPSKGTYYVARCGEAPEQIMGMLMVTLEWSDWRCGWVWWIQSVYVLPEYRRQGVYTALYLYLQKKVYEADDVRGIRLYADKGNLRAQNAYRRLGMTDEHYLTFEWMK